MVYVEKSLNARKLDENPNFNQNVSIEIKNGCEEVKLHVINRSPNSRKDNDDGLCAMIKEMRGTNVLTGDFNFPGIDWVSGVTNEKGRGFYEAINEQFMEQYVMEPTHTSGNVLDLVLCDKEEVVSEVKTDGRIGGSDHDLITFKMRVAAGKEEERMIRDFGRANFVEMRRGMANVDWQRELSGKDANEMWNSIKGSVCKLMKEHIPMKKRRSNKNPPWMDADIKRCLKEKKEAWKRWKETKKEKDRADYRKKVTEAKKKIKKKKNSHEKKIAECRKSNPKMFYAFVNRAKKTRSKIGPLMDKRKKVITDAKQQATLLNEQYASVFTRDEGESPTIESTANGTEIVDVEIEKETIMRMIDNLKEHSAAGPDGIPPRVLKEIRNEIAEPLKILFRESMDTGKIPDDWRDAEVTPIYK